MVLLKKFVEYLVFVRVKIPGIHHYTRTSFVVKHIGIFLKWAKCKGFIIHAAIVKFRLKNKLNSSVKYNNKTSPKEFGLFPYSVRYWITINILTGFTVDLRLL